MFTLARRFTKTVLGPVAVLAAPFPVHANSMITWGPAQNISGDTDVSTVGMLVGAFNLGAPAGAPFGPAVANTTVNGVTFMGLPASGVSSVTAGDFTLSHLLSGSLLGDNSVLKDGPFNLSPSYKALISSAVTMTGFGNGFALTMSELEPGAEYQFQWWSNFNWNRDTQTAASDSVQIIQGMSRPTGNVVHLEGAGAEYDSVAYLPGQFATGTFVADATAAETVYFTTGGSLMVNGFQLRQISAVPDTVPDSGSTGLLLGLGILSLGLVPRFIKNWKR